MRDELLERGAFTEDDIKAVGMLLKGFDEGMFWLSAAYIGNQGWALKSYPYIEAIARLSKHDWKFPEVPCHHNFPEDDAGDGSCKVCTKCVGTGNLNGNSSAVGSCGNFDACSAKGKCENRRARKRES